MSATLSGTLTAAAASTAAVISARSPSSRRLPIAREKSGSAYNLRRNNTHTQQKDELQRQKQLEEEEEQKRQEEAAALLMLKAIEEEEQQRLLLQQVSSIDASESQQHQLHQDEHEEDLNIFSVSEAERLSKLLRKLARVGLPSTSPSSAEASKRDTPDPTTSTPTTATAPQTTTATTDNDEKKEAAAAIASAKQLVKALRHAGLLVGDASSESSSSSNSGDEDDDEQRATRKKEKKSSSGARKSANKVIPSPPPKSNNTGNHARRGLGQQQQLQLQQLTRQQQQQLLMLERQSQLPHDKATVHTLFSHTRQLAHLRRSEAQLGDATTRATVATVTSILDALGGVFQARFVALLVPDELKLRELRCVSYGGVDSAARTQDSFSSYAHGAANLLIPAASLSLHHNCIINTRLPGSGGDSDDDFVASASDPQRQKNENSHVFRQQDPYSHHSTASHENSNVASAGGAAPASHSNTSGNPAAGGNNKNYYSAVSCALSVPIPGPNNYAVAVLHVMDRSFGVENFSQEDESVAWCYAKLLSRVVGAFDAKRRSAPDRQIERALQTVLRSVEAVDGAKIRKLLDGDFSDINLSKGDAASFSGGKNSSGVSWEGVSRAPPVFRTQSGRVQAMVKRLQDSNVLFTTKASEARGKTVECEYHLNLNKDTVGSQRLVDDLFPICVLTDHVHRIADAWYRTAALLAESRAEVLQHQTEVKRLTQEVNAGKVKVDLQRQMLLAGRGGAGGGQNAAAASADRERSGGRTHSVSVAAFDSTQGSPMSVRSGPLNLNDTLLSSTVGGGGLALTLHDTSASLPPLLSSELPPRSTTKSGGGLR